MLEERKAAVVFPTFVCFFQFRFHRFFSQRIKNDVIASPWLSPILLLSPKYLTPWLVLFPWISGGGWNSLFHRTIPRIILYIIGTFVALSWFNDMKAKLLSLIS